MSELVKNKSNNPSGRPVGTTNKLRVTDFFSGTEREQLVIEAKLLAFGDGNSKPDKDMVKFLFEQLFGKATQKIAGDETMDSLKLIQIIKNESGN